jgi:hypothetical protein
MTARYTSSGASSGVATSSTWRLLARVLVRRLHPLEHVDLVASDERGAVALGDLERSDVVAGRP